MNKSAEFDIDISVEIDIPTSRDVKSRMHNAVSVDMLYSPLTDMTKSAEFTNLCAIFGVKAPRKRRKSSCR
jgi:hypothetical protein